MKIRSTINIVNICKYKNWSIADFARHFDLKHQTASYYFKNRVIPVEKAIEVVDFFNITLDDLYRIEITEDYLKKRDPYYIQKQSSIQAEEPKEESSKPQLTEEQKREVMALTSKDPFKAAMKMLLEEIMEEKEKKNKSNKAS